MEGVLFAGGRRQEERRESSSKFTPLTLATLILWIEFTSRKRVVKSIRNL
jgi:hypothetical protein